MFFFKNGLGIDNSCFCACAEVAKRKSAGRGRDVSQIIVTRKVCRSTVSGLCFYSFHDLHVYKANTLHYACTNGREIETAMQVFLLPSFLLSLLLSVVEVHCQPAPNISFMNHILVNHSYVDLTLVGRPDVINGGEGVRCITDLAMCCSGSQGIHRGDWKFPNGTRLSNPGSDVDIFQSRGPQSVDLLQNLNVESPTGIYCCDIPTVAVHHPTDISVRDTVYVGLFSGSQGN